MRRGVWIAVASLAALGLALLALHEPLLGVRELRGATPPAPPRTSVELESRWDAVLDGAVRDGVVDYGLLARRRRLVAHFVGALASFGPTTAPEAFRDRDARLAYYINAYNALVVFAVLERDVRRTVHEVRGWIEPVQGMGFFWAQRFVVDGDSTNLHALENDVLRSRFDDARIHAAINCASASCPRLAERAYHGATLEAELEEAAAGFASAPYVAVDESRREIVLSAIYQWYAEDFEEHAASLGLGASALAWTAQHAPEPEAIDRARRDAYAVRYAPYDWSLNGHW